MHSNMLLTTDALQGLHSRTNNLLLPLDEDMLWDKLDEKTRLQGKGWSQ